jgi:hypothetical protein
MKLTSLSHSSSGAGLLLSLLLALAMTSFANAGEPIKFKAQLVWGTDAATSPNEKHKPVDDELRKQLAKLPLRWTNYFLVAEQKFVATRGEPSKVVLDKCAIEVKVLAGKKVEVTWFGKNGETVGKQIQPLPKGDTLVLAGNAPNSTAWLVAVIRLE